MKTSVESAVRRSFAIFCGVLCLVAPSVGQADELGDTVRRTLREVRGPQAFPRLLEFFEHREWAPTAAYTAGLERLASAPGLDWRIATQLVRERAALARGRGEDGHAAELESQLGLLRRWVVLGPYAVERGATFGTTPPAEPALFRVDLAGRLPSAPTPSVEGVAAPRSLTARPDGLLDFDGPQSAAEPAVAYAVTWVRTDEARPVALRFGAAAATRIWLNGVAVHERVGGLEPVFDQNEVGVWLQRGWNRLTFEVSRGEVHWGVRARLTRPDGRPEPALELWEGQAAPAVVAATTPPGYVAVEPGPYSWWSARADERGIDGGGEFLAGLARVSRAWGRAVPLDRQPRALRERVTADRDAAALMALAATEQSPARRASLLQDVLRAHPNHPRALVALARLEKERLRMTRAQALLRQVDELPAPGPRVRVEAAVLRAEILRDAQLWGEASAALSSYAPQDARAAEVIPAVLRTLAGIELERGARERALEVYDLLAETASDDAEVLFWRAELSRDLGRPAAALAALARMAALSPDLPHPLLQKAALLENLGRLDESRAAFGALEQRFAFHPDMLEAVGRFHHRQGETGRAIAVWRRALELAPQKQALRAYLLHVAPSVASFEEGYARPLVDTLRRWQELAVQPAPGGDAARVLLDQHVVRLHGNGTVSRYRAERIGFHRPLDDESRAYRVEFDPLRQRVEILEALVVSADGRRRELFERREYALSEAWYGLYYDLHAIEIPFGDVRAGDLLAVSYRLLDLEPEARGGAFGDLVWVQGTAPRDLFDYTFVGPADVPIGHALATPDGPLEAVREQLSGGGFRYVVRDVPGVPWEVDAPGHAERRAHLHVSSFRDYEHVGRWYAALVAGARRGSDAVREAARAAARGARGAGARREIVSRLHAAVVERVRYVGLEFGIHGILPYDAALVWERRFGDCKDTATLLSVMLAELGVPSQLVLVRWRSRGTLPRWPASLAAFEHAIVRVPGQDGSPDVWIDPTVREAPPGTLSPEVQGAFGLAVDAAGGQLVQIPYGPAPDNLATVSLAGALEPSGAAELSVRESWSGWRGAQFRERLRARTQRRQILEERLARRLVGARVRGLEAAGVGTPARILTLRYTAQAPALGTPEAAGLRVPLSPAVSPVTPRVSGALEDSARARRLPLDLRERFRDEVSFAVRLPSGWEPVELPPDIERVESFGVHSRKVRFEEGTLTVSHSWSVTATRVSPDQLTGLRAFCRGIDEALDETVLVVPPVANPRGTRAAPRGSEPRREGGGS